MNKILGLAAAKSAAIAATTPASAAEAATSTVAAAATAAETTTIAASAAASPGLSAENLGLATSTAAAAARHVLQHRRILQHVRQDHEPKSLGRIFKMEHEDNISTFHINI